MKKKNRLIWLTVGCMVLAFGLSYRLMWSEYAHIALACYFISAGYIMAFLHSNRNLFWRVFMGKKKSHRVAAR